MEPNNPPQQVEGAPAPQNNPTPQTTPSSEAIHLAAEKARIEERTKLRGEIEAEKQKVSNLTAQVTELTQRNETLASELKMLKESMKPDGGGVDIEKLINQVAERLNGQYSSQIAELQSALNTEKQTRERLTIEQLRTQLIQRNGGDSALIPELVHGSNEAELLASIEASKAAHQRILQSAGRRPSTPSQNNNNGQGGGQGEMPAVPGGATTMNDNSFPNVRSMSREDYKKSREALIKKVAGRYNGNVVTA